MKHLLIVALFSFIGSAFAGEKPVCEVEGNKWYKSANLTISSFKQQSYEECYAKGQELFDSTVADGTQIINPIKSTLTIKSWTTQFKTVKITYRANGEKITDKLVRDEVVKSPVTVKVLKLKSGFKCWTNGDCETVSE